jgi:hypothetical protein
MQGDSGTHEEKISLLPPAQMNNIKGTLLRLIEEFKTIANDNLTAMQRRRKIGAGTRNYGFIDKVSDLADANPNYAHFFSIDALKNCIRNIEICRSIVLDLQSFARMISNTMMIYSDDAYSMALNYYNMVKEMSRQGDPEAMELYRELKTYFKRAKRVSDEPTEKQQMRDANAFIKGRKHGKLLIENVKPKLTGGVHKVIDEKFTNSARFRESEEGDIEE